jgi:hypothetical protein
MYNRARSSENSRHALIGTTLDLLGEDVMPYVFESAGA